VSPLVGILALSVGVSGMAAEGVRPPVAVPLDADHWHLADGARFVEIGGRRALTGMAYVKGADFQDGTIEADLWITGEVDFAGIMFRVQSFDEYEWVWLRTHKANGQVQDGLQYAPAFHGVPCWQLNGGPGGIAPVTAPSHQWVHMRLEVRDDTATLYVGDMTRPALIIHPLQLGLERGSVGLQAYRGKAAYFSNLSYQVDEVDPALPPTDGRRPGPGVLTGWRLSPSYPVPSLETITTYPAARLAEDEGWIVPATDEQGLVNITRYHGRTGGVARPGKAPDCAILRTTLDAERARRVQMRFGYSDAVALFLNGAPLYWGNNAFLSRNAADGEWISLNDSVFLDLEEGQNELLAVVAEDFGGWGFQARLTDTEGMTGRGE
jgi:hypothetical protein